MYEGGGLVGCQIVCVTAFVDSVSVPMPLLSVALLLDFAAAETRRSQRRQQANTAAAAAAAALQAKHKETTRVTGVYHADTFNVPTSYL